MNRICKIPILLVIMTIFLGGGATKAFTHKAEKIMVYDFMYKPAETSSLSIHQC